jgi:hypothetical protein
MVLNAHSAFSLQAMKAKNVFESSKLCCFFCKLLNFNFITIEGSARGGYSARTSRLDKIRFILGVFVISWNFIESFGLSSNSDARAIIFEIGMTMCSKWQILLGLYVMIGTFHYRFEYFKVISGLHWIDRKVWRELFLFLFND